MTTTLENGSKTRKVDRRNATEALAIAIGLIAVLAMTPAAQSQTYSMPGGDSQATKHALRATYFNSGNWAGAPFAGDNIQQPVDGALTIECPGTSTCTIYAGISVQAGGDPNAPASEGGFCIYVDGVAAYCGDVNESQPNFLQNFVQLIHFGGVAPGTHTVQTYFFSGANTYLWAYSTEYQVYTP